MNKRLFDPAVLMTAVVLVVFALFANVAQAGSEEKAIDQVRIDFSKTFSAGDIKGLMRLVDPDAVWMPPGQSAVVGRNKVEAYLKTALSSVRSELDLKPGRISLGGPWAFLSGAYTRVDTGKPDGKKARLTGYYLLVLKKQADGSWKIAQDIWN